MNQDKNNTEEACCDTGECCRVEAIVSVDGRGQLVLPKEVRDDMGLTAGDKLAVVALTREGKTCCLMLTRTDSLAKSARDLLGPLVNEI